MKKRKKNGLLVHQCARLFFNWLIKHVWAKINAITRILCLYSGKFCYGVKLDPSWYDTYVKHLGRMRVKWELSDWKEIWAMLFPREQPLCACARCLFCLDWNFISITRTSWGFFSILPGLKILARGSETGLGFLARSETLFMTRHFHFKGISFRTRAEISAQPIGLKFAM